MNDEIRILGILVNDRMKESEKLQKLLTKYGCSIKTRLGLHEASATTCSKHGLIVLELTGESAEWDKLEKSISRLSGVEIQKMSFSL